MRGSRARVGGGSVALAALIVGACGDAASSEARGPIPLTEVRAELARTACRVYAHCRSLGDNDNSLMRWIASDVDACVAYWTPARSDHDLLGVPIAAAEAGLVRYDGVVMRRCLDHVEATCMLGFVNACIEAAFDGRVPLGGACDEGDQCAGDAFCALGDTCGVCVASLPIGAQCDFEGCSQADGPAECVAHLCVAHATREVALGAACDWFEAPEGEPEPVCPAGSACVDGDFETGEPSACRAHVPVGGACGDDDVCADLARCLGERDESGGLAGTCTVVVQQDEVGAPCDATRWCSVWSRLACVDGRCASIGDGGAGTRCSRSDFSAWPTSCLEGFRCDLDTGTCAPYEPSCAGDADCFGGARCLAGRCSHLGAAPCASR